MDIREEFEKLPVIESKLEHLFFEDGFYYAKYDDADQDEYFVNGAWYAFQEQQNKIDAHNKKLSIFIDELKKTHSNDKDNKMDYWRGFADCAEASVKVFYRDVGFAGED